MLSPHELATLLLACHAPDQVDLKCDEFSTLLQQEFVMIGPSMGGYRQVTLTEQGRSI